MAGPGLLHRVPVGGPAQYGGQGDGRVQHRGDRIARGGRAGRDRGGEGLARTGREALAAAADPGPVAAQLGPVAAQLGPVAAQLGPVAAQLGPAGYSARGNLALLAPTPPPPAPSRPRAACPEQPMRTVIAAYALTDRNSGVPGIAVLGLVVGRPDRLRRHEAVPRPLRRLNRARRSGSVVRMTSMSGKVCLVTGATSGIGRETAARLAELGATVLVAGRDPGRGRAALEEIHARAPGAAADLLTADLSSLAEVRRLAAEVLARHDRLDVLVNNAGVIATRRRLTREGYESMFATNHLAPFLLTKLLRDRLLHSAPARVVTVSSNAHASVRSIRWDTLPAGNPDYGLSKLANILFTTELARRLTGTGVVANCLHPGLVRTALGREVTGAMRVLVALSTPFQSPVAEGAATSVYLASAPEAAETTGGYYVRGRRRDPSPLARDPEAAARLWDLSERLTA
ncbi:SDR family oxidoreductase [Dactylosporangium sp. CA-092794]|uniref:SDR family oxidoreductase n=1 Tax=Dactylosporangium sp. CA-092794 TaxID=3239929 RepID=UPI003D93A127